MSLQFVIAQAIELWGAALDALAGPIDALLDPSHRVFAPFVLSAGVIAVALRCARGLPLARALSGTLSPRVWAHPSALADYRLVAVRALLRALTVGSARVSSVAVAALTLSWLRLNLGLPSLHAPALLVGALLSVAAFTAEDLARYLVHRAMHRVPALWAFHRVHHSAEVLTPVTLYRTHPVEGALNQAAAALAVGVVTGLFAWAFGPAVRTWHLFGLDALALAWTLAGANLRHSHVWLSWGPRVERWLLSPAQHQVHHSRDPAHADKNLGTALALWDRLAGSLYVTSSTHPERLRFGLADDAAPIAHTVPSMLLTPFATLFQRARRAAVIPRAATLLVIALTATCSTERAVDRATLLQGFARCTTRLHDDFHSAAGELARTTAAWSDAPASTQSRDAARAAWEAAIDVWQRAEMHRYGPSGGFDVVAGQNLRENVYAWPDVNRCLLEQRLASRGWEGAGFAQLPTSVRGLAALEYLLFVDGTDNACPADDALNTSGAWAALGADELTRRRAAYARAVADDVLARATALRTAWAPNGFEAQLVTAGNGSTTFRTQQDAFNALGNALTHIETDLRDLRVGRPLGVFNCTTGTCPQAVESPWARRSVSHIRNNLAGARMLLEGCPAGDNLGFDDRLVSAGAAPLATRMRTLLAAVDTAVNALPDGDLAASLTRDRASVQRLYDALKGLTDFLKTEFVATLQITGSRIEGDND